MLSVCFCLIVLVILLNFEDCFPISDFECDLQIGVVDSGPKSVGLLVDVPTGSHPNSFELATQ